MLQYLKLNLICAWELTASSCECVRLIYSELGLSCLCALQECCRKFLV